MLVLSNSGNSPEIKVLVPCIKAKGNKIIAVVGDQQSFLAHSADYSLNSFVQQEVVEQIMAPTSSTTLQLALGDALAVCLMKMNDFTLADFAKNHPGGAIGKQINLTVGTLVKSEHKAAVRPNTPVVEVIYEISSKRLGATAVLEDNKVIGMITDGDIRRMLQNEKVLKEVTAQDIMSINPKRIDPSTLAKDALKLLNQYNINQLIVEEAGTYIGMLHIHELLKEGINA